MCWRNFCKFSWWLNNVKSRSKIALFFSNERHFEIWFPKKRSITFFWSKLSKLHKKDTILHVATTFSLKHGETRTSHGPIPHHLSLSFVQNRIFKIKNITTQSLGLAVLLFNTIPYVKLLVFLWFFTSCYRFHVYQRGDYTWRIFLSTKKLNSVIKWLQLIVGSSFPFDHFTEKHLYRGWEGCQTWE